MLPKHETRVRLPLPAPKWNFPRFCHPVGRLFLDFGGAKARYFLGGNKEIGRRLRRHFCFVFLGSTRRFRGTATFWQVDRHLLRFYR